MSTVLSILMSVPPKPASSFMPETYALLIEARSASLSVQKRPFIVDYQLPGLTKIVEKVANTAESLAWSDLKS